jgi:hypothetical protein
MMMAVIEVTRATPLAVSAAEVVAAVGLAAVVGMAAVAPVAAAMMKTTGILTFAPNAVSVIGLKSVLVFSILQQPNATAHIEGLALSQGLKRLAYKYSRL